MGLLYVKTADGRKKPSVWVWLALLAVLLIGSIFIVTNSKDSGLAEIAGNTKEKAAREAPKPIQTGESTKGTSDMDAETLNAMNAQISRETEENNGYLPPERQQEIQKKYAEEYRRKQTTNFQPSVAERLGKLNPMATPTPAPKVGPETTIPKKTGYRTLAERMQEQGVKAAGRSNKQATDFKPPTKIAGNPIPTPTPNGPNDTLNWSKATNLLPLGTFIPCVLDGDIVTSNLSSHVWGNVVLDVTFRRQLQLPQGLVRIRGKTATTPVQNVVDVMFDTMVFSDGTELPIQGFAYAAFDPRYPNRFRTRGIPGEIIVPPMFVRLQALVYAAALGASDAYIQNYINENTYQDTTFTTTPVIDPVTGQTSTQIQQSQQNPTNQNIGGTVALSAGQAALEDLVKDLQKDLEKYQPYLIVEKGTPFFVQLDATVNVTSRRVNGTALAREEELQRNLKLKEMGVPMPDMKETYPPGDARAKYQGAGNATTINPSAAAGMSQAQMDAIQQQQAAVQGAQSNLGASQQAYQAASANAAAARTQNPGGAPAQSLTPEQLASLLQSMANQ